MEIVTIFEVITVRNIARKKRIIAPLTLTAENRCVILDCISGNLSADREHVQWNPLDFTLLMIKGMTATLSAPDIDWQVEMTPVDFVSEIIVKMTQVCCTQCFYSLTLLVTSLSHLDYRTSLKFGFLVSKETVVLRRWERSKQKFGFIKRVDRG